MYACMYVCVASPHDAPMPWLYGRACVCVRNPFRHPKYSQMRYLTEMLTNLTNLTNLLRFVLISSYPQPPAESVKKSDASKMAILCRYIGYSRFCIGYR